MSEAYNRQMVFDLLNCEPDPEEMNRAESLTILKLNTFLSLFPENADTYNNEKYQAQLVADAISQLFISDLSIALSQL